jgi:hypothetical protein
MATVTVDVDDFARGVWKNVSDGEANVRILIKGKVVASKLVRTISFRTSLMQIYVTKDFQWDREYDWLIGKTSIRIN